MFLSSITSSFLITVLCGMVIIKTVPLGGWLVFSNLYFWCVATFILNGFVRNHRQSKPLQAVSHFFRSLSGELHGTRLPLAVCAAVFSMTGNDEKFIIATGLCTTGCSLVCILRDLAVFAPVLPRYRGGRA